MEPTELGKLIEDLEKGSYATLEEARRARRETNKLLEDIAKARYESMDEAGRARLDETRRHSEAIVAMYRHAEEAEDALLIYQMALPKPERDALRRDATKYNALSHLFFSAESAEELKQYASMTVDELVKLSAELAGKKKSHVEQD